MTTETTETSESNNPTFSDYVVPLLAAGMFAYAFWSMDPLGLFRSPLRPLSPEEARRIDTLAALAENAGPQVGEIWLCGTSFSCSTDRLYQTDTEERAADACPVVLAVPRETGSGIVAFGPQRIDTAFQLVGMGRHWIWSEDAGSAVNPDLRMANMISLRVIGENAATTSGRYHDTYYSVDENAPAPIGFVDFLDLREIRDPWSYQGNRLYCRRGVSNEEVDGLLGLSDP